MIGNHPTYLCAELLQSSVSQNFTKYTHYSNIFSLNKYQGLLARQTYSCKKYSLFSGLLGYIWLLGVFVNSSCDKYQNMVRGLSLRYWQIASASFSPK